MPDEIFINGFQVEDNQDDLIILANNRMAKNNLIAAQKESQRVKDQENIPTVRSLNFQGYNANTNQMVLQDKYGNIIESTSQTSGLRRNGESTVTLKNEDGSNASTGKQYKKRIVEEQQSAQILHKIAGSVAVLYSTKGNNPNQDCTCPSWNYVSSSNVCQQVCDGSGQYSTLQSCIDANGASGGGLPVFSVPTVISFNIVRKETLIVASNDPGIKKGTFINTYNDIVAPFLVPAGKFIITPPYADPLHNYTGSFGTFAKTTESYVQYIDTNSNIIPMFSTSTQSLSAGIIFDFEQSAKSVYNFGDYYEVDTTSVTTCTTVSIYSTDNPYDPSNKVVKTQKICYPLETKTPPTEGKPSSNITNFYLGGLSPTPIKLPITLSDDDTYQVSLTTSSSTTAIATFQIGKSSKDKTQFCSIHVFTINTNTGKVTEADYSNPTTPTNPDWQTWSQVYTLDSRSQIQQPLFKNLGYTNNGNYVKNIQNNNYFVYCDPSQSITIKGVTGTFANMMFANDCLVNLTLVQLNKDYTQKQANILPQVKVNAIAPGVDPNTIKVLAVSPIINTISTASKQTLKPTSILSV